MKAIYIVSFPLASSSGHQGATAEKVAAFQREGVDLEVCACNPRVYRYSKLMALLFVEITSLFLTLKRRPDFIVSRGYSGFFAFIASRRRTVFAREVHSDLYEESNLIASGIKAVLIKAAAMYSLFLDRQADRIIFNHPFLANHYLRKYDLKEDRVAVFYNGVSPHKIISLDGCLDVNKGSDIVFVGNVSKWHGINKMLQVFVAAKEKGLTNKLRIIGPINDDIDPAFLSRKDIIFMGYVDNDKVQSHLEEASAFFLPVAEVRVSPGSPLKLYEYLAKAKPIITQRDLPGYSDEVNSYRCGVCVDFDKPDESANDIVNFFRDYSVDRRYVIRKVKDCATWDSRVRGWINHIMG